MTGNEALRTDLRSEIGSWLGPLAGRADQITDGVMATVERHRSAAVNQRAALRFTLPSDVTFRRDELAQRLHDDAASVTRQVVERQEAWLRRFVAAGVNLDDYVLEAGPLESERTEEGDAEAWHIRCTQTLRLKRRDEE